MSDLAPVVLFVYNRPWHTKQTLEALEKNELSQQSQLYVFADGPKDGASEEDLKKIQKVHQVVQSKKWCKETILIKRERNYGLADNISNAVSQIVNDYGSIIVLEDDIVTSPGFLVFMNEALSLYKDDDQVMHISGYMFPIQCDAPETFFYNTASCWGWATWARAWQFFNNDAHFLMEAIETNKGIRKFDIEGTYPFFEHLRLNAIGGMRTWAVKWYASFFLKGGYALHPYPSLVNNIGHDGQGENCDVSTLFSWDVLADRIMVTRKAFVENRKVRQAMHKFNDRIMGRSKPPATLVVKQFLWKVLPQRLLNYYKLKNDEWHKSR
jgi:hypothetical protein